MAAPRPTAAVWTVVTTQPYRPRTRRRNHKVIWRGPYIKGPDGAPLLVGPKAQACSPFAGPDWTGQVVPPSRGSGDAAGPHHDQLHLIRLT
jgi:hypothetical protein